GGQTCGPTPCGTVFKLAPPCAGQPQWTETVLHSFQGSPSDGVYPLAGLNFDSSGALYGTTFYGGSAGAGTVFKLMPPAPTVVGRQQWTETVLYSFKGGSDGADPWAGVIFDTHGALYGTTWGIGTVFKLQCNGVREIFGGTVHQFCPGG
ncbi:MAG: choice-of-anchor tandem repeat GloVer-containing protein, partial [Methylocystis sp.]